MAAATILPLDFTAPAASQALRALGPVLVATDGSEGSDAALRAACLLRAEGGLDGHVLGVVEAMPPVPPGFGLDTWPAELARRMEAETRAVVEPQVRRMMGTAGDWPLEIRRGAPARVIAEMAAEQDAGLVIVGKGEHGVVGRLLGDETALQVIRLANVPVLVAAPAFAGRPRRAVFAIDYSQDSVRAARTALPLLRPDATVYLLHVVQLTGLSASVLDALLGDYDRDEPFVSVRRQLDIPPGMTVEPITLKGDPGHAIADFARAAGADLVVSGSTGLGFIARLLLGSVATSLVRRTRCSALVVPRPADERGRA